MMEISTPNSNSLTNKNTSVSSSPDSLNEEDSLFYASIKKDLDLLAKEPGSKAILNIINYSKSI